MGSKLAAEEDPELMSSQTHRVYSSYEAVPTDGARGPTGHLCTATLYGDRTMVHRPRGEQQERRDQGTAAARDGAKRLRAQPSVPGHRTTTTRIAKIQPEIPACMLGAGGPGSTTAHLASPPS